MTFKSISFLSVSAFSVCLGLSACSAADVSTETMAAPASADYVKTSKPGALVQFSHTLGKATADGQALTLNISEGYDGGTLTIEISDNENLSVSGSGGDYRFAMSDDGRHTLNLSVKALATGKHYLSFIAIAESGDGQVARSSYAVPVYSGVAPEKVGSVHVAPADSSTYSGGIIAMEAEETISTEKAE